MGSHLEEFIEELSTEFAVDGVEIIDQKEIRGITQISIKYIDEEGTLHIKRDDEDITISYDLKRERKEIKKGLMGAISGAGLGGLLRGALRGSSNLSDQVAGAVGGAVAGGAYKAYEGYEESKEDRTKFAKLLSQTVDEVSKEIKSKYAKQVQEKEGSTAEAREEKKEIENLLEEINLANMSLKEELVFADKDEETLKRIKARLLRSEQLFEEAKADAKAQKYSEAKVKATVARNMVRKAQDLYAQ